MLFFFCFFFVPLPDARSASHHHEKIQQHTQPPYFFEQYHNSFTVAQSINHWYMLVQGSFKLKYMLVLTENGACTECT